MSMVNMNQIMVKLDFIKQFEWGGKTCYWYLFMGRLQKFEKAGNVYRLYIGQKAFDFQSLEEGLEFVFEAYQQLKNKYGKI